MNDWRVFYGNPDPHDEISRLPAPPSWRRFEGRPKLDKNKLEERWNDIKQLVDENSREYERGKSFRILSEDSEDNKETPYKEYQELIEGVNAAIYLRRPLLVTGRPGSGKTSLAYAIAYELQLSPVLAWSITTRTNLQDGLYRYDAIARLQDLQLLKLKQEYSQEAPQPNQTPPKLEEKIGRYLRLGPVGTAFFPTLKPRVLLIDEIDKSDINLPNDLLNLFEEGEYLIPELERLKTRSVSVGTADPGIEVSVENGRVQCHKFPIVVMTSNGERDFPAPFLRRCLRVSMPDPTDSGFLRKVVDAHFVQELGAEDWNKAQTIIDDLIQDFVNKQGKDVSTDRLLNTVYLFSRQVQLNQIERDSLKDLLWKRLDSSVDQ